jgi:hypothetical protein
MAAPRPVATHLLPPQLRALVGLCGVADTLALLRLWGGQRRWLARQPADCPAALQQALSAPGLAALCASDFGGRATDWPKADKVLRQWTHQAMQAERAAGATAGDIAQRYGYTDRRVRTIAPRAARAEEPGQQRGLFDE